MDGGVICGDEKDGWEEDILIDVDFILDMLHLRNLWMCLVGKLAVLV